MSEKLEQAAELLAAWSKESTFGDDSRLDMTIGSEDLVSAVHALMLARWGTLSAITGLDLGPQAGTIEALYHFCAGDAVLTLRVPLDRMCAILPTICSAVPSARVLEWELSEMFGVTITGISSTEHLYLPDGWPERVYPMRKDAMIEATHVQAGEQAS